MTSQPRMLAVVQARMTSRRLPGKVLARLADRPLLAWTLSRLEAADGVTDVVVATSDDPTDDAVADYCALQGVPCHRGPLVDVSERMAGAARHAAAAAFLRVNGDSPLIDPAVIDQAISLYHQSEVDLVTNVLVRTFPKGQSVEVLRTSSFLRVCSELADPQDREHVTRPYYSEPSSFRMIAFTSGMDAGHIQFSVDTAEDHAAIERLIGRSNGKPGGWRELVSLMRGMDQ